MNINVKVRAFVLLALVVVALHTAGAVAEPCLIVYPVTASEYHYDVNEYYTVSYGHPLYDPAYDRGGGVLIDANTDEIALEIYQTPGLAGFEVSTNGEEGYFFIGSYFDLTLDGFNNQPTVYENIILVFEPNPGYCTPTISVDGDPVTGFRYPLGDLAVSTPTPDGNNYSDTITKRIMWGGCYGMRMWAFADTNHDGVWDGGECFTAFSHDATVPVVETSWGAIKTLYND
jgi:hypothetical protein